MLAAYLNKYKDGVCLFYDSEFGAKESYFKSFGIDPARIVHSPLLNVEQLKFDMMAQLDGLTDKDKVIVIIDSVGNLASKKEVEDALKQNSAADMSRAKAFKSFFRMVTPQLHDKGITLIAIAHTYMEQCLAGDTLIKTEFGAKAIKDITIQDRVFALTGLQQVTAVYKPEELDSSGKKFMKITFDDGTFVNCTNNHKFLNANMQWTPAENFTVGTQLY